MPQAPPQLSASVLLLAAGIMSAQEIQPNPTFRAGTDLVQVSVVARDNNGNPVADLRREEFQLFDNGVPQEIRLFVADLPAAIPKPPFVKAPNTFTNRTELPAGARSGYSVILLDNLITGFGDPLSGEEGTGFGVQSVLRAVRAMPPGENVAIFAFRRKLHIVSEFTADRETLERRLRAWKPSVDDAQVASGSGDPATAYNAPPIMAQAAPEAAAGMARAQAAYGAVDLQIRVDAMNAELQQIADHLAGIPGRKKLIWMANRFPVAGGPTMLKLANANVAIYPVDENGVLSPSPDQVQMQAIAALTGGVAFSRRNDLNLAIGEALADDRVSYTLGFYQMSEDKRPVTHQLAVRVSRPGVTLRYRTTYQVEKPVASRSAVGDFVKALYRPVNATAISITAWAKRTADRLSVSISVDVAALDLELSEGLWRGKAEFAARFVNTEGVPVGDVLAQTATFNLRPATYARMQQGGLPMQREFKIPPKAAELKLLVANIASGKVGTLSIPLSEVETFAPKKTRSR